MKPAFFRLALTLTPFMRLPLLSQDARVAGISVETIVRVSDTTVIQTAMTGDGACVLGNDGGRALPVRLKDEATQAYRVDDEIQALGTNFYKA